MTGWAHVNWCNAFSWSEKFALDVWHVDHRSYAFDLKILWLTIMKVVGREGISALGDATMPSFRGNAPAGREAPPV
jgi:lipopolysaccharide/colanic/teichoic acid biosynthesis glycosyltransferase